MMMMTMMMMMMAMMIRQMEYDRVHRLLRTYYKSPYYRDEETCIGAANSSAEIQAAAGIWDIVNICQRVTTTLARYWAAPMPFFLLAFFFRGLSFHVCPVALPTLPHAQHSHHMHVTCMGVSMHVE